jgi:hypothetical protein
MHDQGPLPELKEGGPMTALLGCCIAAKEFNDEFLTQMIQEEKKHKPQQSYQNPSALTSKKSKTNND